MICLRRFPLRHRLTHFTSPSPLLCIRCKSSQRRIQVVSDPPRIHRPTTQQHKWPFLSAVRSPVLNTTDHEESPLFSNNSFPSSDSPFSSHADYDRSKTIRRAIDLTTIEKRTLDILRKTEEYINQSRPLNNKVALYLVGGWVRDKLLGKQPPDMDFCVENIRPAEFVQALIDLNGFNSHSPRLIPLNPGETSPPPIYTGQKATVGTHMFEYDPGTGGQRLQVAGIIIYDTTTRMEFAEMRGEDARKPDLQTDAYAREFTINAIYFRLQNMALLDPTGSGIEDLQRKVFRTPKRPKSTFSDDPIRVIRLLRFASRFHDDGFKIAKETFQTSIDPDIRLALTTKFPVERINRELAWLLKPRNNPSQVFRFLHQTKYYSDLFSPPHLSSDNSIPSSISSKNAEYVSAGWFISKLSANWDLWTPFEESLIDLPSSTTRKKNKSSIRDLITLRQNVQTFAYAIALIIPWRKHPEPPSSHTAKTIAGSILEGLGTRFVRAWELIDGMFFEDVRTCMALERVLEVDSKEMAVEFKREYGQFWAGYVLCAGIFRWVEMCEGRIKVGELEEVWNLNEEYFRRMALAVDRLQWNSWKEKS